MCNMGENPNKIYGKAHFLQNKILYKNVVIKSVFIHRTQTLFLQWSLYHPKGLGEMFYPVGEDGSDEGMSYSKSSDP